MSGDDLDRSFLSDGRSSAASRPSVFGLLNQDEVISRLDANDDDDLDSDFFGDSLQDVEDAATRMFDVGIRTITNDQPTAPASAFDSPTGDAVRAAHSDLPGVLGTDAEARRAFILGGPEAIPNG